MPEGKLFLFDLDGTLVRTGGVGLKALSQAFFDLYQIDDVLAKIKPSGKTDPAIFREIIQTFQNRDMTADEFEKISACYLSYLDREVEKAGSYGPLPGVTDFISLLKNQPRTAIALGTGNIEKGARIKLRPTGLNDQFDIGGFGSDAEDRAEMLKVGRDRAQDRHTTDFPEKDVYVIGDTHLDILAARRAGFQSIAVATGHWSAEELKKSNPDFCLKDMTEAPTVLSPLIQDTV